jgi:hypothetical protein
MLNESARSVDCTSSQAEDQWIASHFLDCLICDDLLSVVVQGVEEKFGAGLVWNQVGILTVIMHCRHRGSLVREVPVPSNMVRDVKVIVDFWFHWRGRHWLSFRTLL